MASGHRDQKHPAYFPRSVHGGSAGLSLVAAPPIAQPGQPVKGKAAATRRCSAPLTGCPGCATSQGATGDISSRAAPFPWIGKGRGDRVEPLPPQTAVFPRLICGQLAISKLCPARVSGPGFIGAGIVSFPRPDLSEYCQHLNLWEVSMSSKKSVAYGSESQSTVVAGKKRIRSTSVCVWLSQDEQAKIRERMADVGIRNLSAYMRKMALNGYVLHVDLAPVKEIVSLQRRCANNLNQIAVRANTQGGVYPNEIKALQKDYADLWEPLSELLERLSEIVAL